MATLGEFASLVQLGFGIGVGLSLFRAPMDLRVRSIGRAIDAQLRVLSGVRTAAARERKAKLSTLKLAFADQRRRLDKLNLPFMAATLFCAALNLAALVWASLDATHVVTGLERNALLFISVGAYVLVLLVLEAVARFYFREVDADLQSLNARS
jgi:hypothetical protein